MQLIETFSRGEIPDFASPPQKTIETYISKLFFSTDRVVKIYKNEKYFFGDLKTPTSRREFLEKDFHWNNKMSPGIYLRLQGMKQQNNSWTKTGLSSARDFYILMKRIDDTKTLTSLLLSKNITAPRLENIADTMVARIGELTVEHKQYFNYLQRQWSYPEYLSLDLADNQSWAYAAHPALPKARTKDIVARLKTACGRLPYFQKFSMSDMTFAIDSQSDNILLLNNKISFLDIMPPKESWRIQDLFFTITRPAVDSAVLDSPAKAQIIYDAFSRHQILPSQAVQNIYAIKSALIKTAYLFVLKQPRLANKYLAYIDHLLPTLPR